MVQKKKEWYTILSPKVFGSTEIGETVSDLPKKVIGRILTVNAKELTGDFKKSHISIRLVVTDVNKDKAFTEVKGYSVSRPYIQRFLHKGMSPIDIIHDLKTGDGQKIRVKCMATINGKVQAGKRKLIRDRFMSEMDKMMGGMTLDNIVFIATTNRIQKELGSKLKKTYPLRFVEIKKISVLENEVTPKPEEKKE